MLCATIVVGCSGSDVTDSQSDIVIERFDQDLQVVALKGDSLSILSKRYGVFFENYTHGVLQIEKGEEEEIQEALRKFVNDSSVKSVNAAIDSVFGDLESIHSQVNEFSLNYHKHFPQEDFPRVVTLNSFFNYAIVADSNILGLGLDMFLGSDSRFYQELRFPLYLRKRMIPEQVVPSAALGWYESEHPGELAGKDFLSQMIHQGKSLYYVQMMLPDIKDSLLLGYSENELNWCEENEERIWALFIENKMLFSTDRSLYSKFLVQAPKTSGFPDEAPDKIASYIGLKIVREYMDNNNSTLKELIDNKDALGILEGSSYKP
jgi:hypothetical protein